MVLDTTGNNGRVRKSHLKKINMANYCLRKIFKMLTFLIFACIFHSQDILASEKYRVVILTDMTHDDGNSLIRYLYYSNEFDTEAIIVTPQLPDYYHDSKGPWLKVNSILDAYSIEYDQLTKHYDDYPTPQALKEVTKKGRGALPIIWLTNEKKFSGPIGDRYVESEWGDINYSDWIGEGNTPNGESKDSEGSEFLQEIFEKDDDRPIFVQCWGGPITFIQALYRFKQKHSKEEFAALMNKLHVYGILLQDITFDYLIDLNKVNDLTCANHRTVRSTYEGERVHPRYLLHDPGHFWYYVFGRDSGYVKPMTADEVNGHGPMSDIYDNGGEGDTPAFLYLLGANRGLNDPFEPTQGSWGSLFVPMGEDFPDGYYHTCGVEISHLKRWIQDAKNSFENRLDFSFKSPNEVNHEPVIVLDGENSMDILEIQGNPGGTIKLDASASFDPDGDKISYNWFFYPEASTTKDLPAIKDSAANKIEVNIPRSMDNETLHLVLEVEDAGSPSLKRYRRVVIKVKS